MSLCKHWRSRLPWPYFVSMLLLQAAGAASAESGGRLLYYLNCLGCHPMPARDPGAFGGEARFVGAFYQTEAGRRFFVRMPPAGSPPLSPGDDALLVDEITTWKGACLALTASTPLIRYRQRSTGP